MDVTKTAARVRVKGLLAALRSERLLGVALGGTLLLALGLRFYGLDWDDGYPFTPHPDERAILMNVGELRLPPLGDLHLLGSAEDSPWNPGWFPYGSFPLYLLKLVQYGYGWLTGVDLHDLRIAGRAISALADLAAVGVIYLLGRRVYGRREGLLAAFMASVAVIHIQLSHFYAVDTLLALFVVAALYFMYRIAQDGRPRDSVLAGVFIGLGLATKVSQAPILLVFVTAHFLFVIAALRSAAEPAATRERVRLSLRGIAGGVAVALAVLVVTQPYMLLDWSHFYGDFVEQSEMVRRIRDYPYTRQYIDTMPYWYHVSQLSAWGLGWPMGIAAWGGLVYAALRGSPVRFGLAYLAVGWILPMAVLLVSTSILAIAAASLIAVVSTVSMVPLRSRESRGDLLLLAWVLPYLLVIGALEVKFLRYLIPVTPVLLLFGARLMLAVWDGLSRSRPGLRPVAAAGGVLILAATAFYAFAYLSIYGEPHTAIRTADWLKSNVSEGSVVLKEHWEEIIPGVGGMRELPLYEDDTPQKVGRVSDMLAEADYLVFYSNRLYGTIPRLPERYPVSREYYRALFTGRLGYDLAHAETAYPTLAGFSFVHETFARPDLPVPVGLDTFEPAARSLQRGFADESFSVYDHPTVMVFRNAARFDAETIRRVLGAAAPDAHPAPAAAGGADVGLLLPPEDVQARREGGTWSRIVRTGSWTNRMPVLSWLIVVEGLALLAWPLAFPLLRPLADRGYLFAKVSGLLGAALIAWLLASLKFAPFSAGSVGFASVVIAAASLAVLLRRRSQILDFVRAQWRVLLAGEALFLIAFFAFVAVRMANPDLWHPYLGGEKPMDFAYLNAVLKSSYMPPYDPWFAGGYLNYYYWGQFLTATLIHATGVEPSVAYNLAVPLFFALTATAAFGLVYNLAETTRLRAGPGPDGAERSRRFPWSSIVAGLGGAVFVAVLGNLDGAVQVGEGIWRAAIGHAHFGAFDFWRSSRMMPPGSEITEFPFFTFLFADLHAHLMALPFTLLALGLSLAVLLDGTRRRDDAPSRWAPLTLARLVVVGVVVGALRLINTWDYPTYLIIAAASVLLAAYFSNGGLSLVVLIESGLKSLLVFLAGYLVFLPYHLSYETFFSSIEGTTNTTVLWRFLGIAGLFVFIVGSFFLRESAPGLVRSWRALKRRAIALAAVTGAAETQGPRSGEGDGVPVVRLAVLIAVATTVALAAGLLVYMAISTGVGSTIPFVSALIALVLVVGVGFMRSDRADAPQLTFVAVIVGISLLLVIGLDVYRVEGDVDRMNSVFKFYLQVWVMLAVAAAYLLWRLWGDRRTPLSPLGTGSKLWLALLAVLVVSASVYPVLGTRARLRTRFQPLPATLDGAAYMREAVYHDANGAIDLASDYEGIRWLQKEVEGSPVVLEGVTPQYRWGGRVSVYTGLPSIVGWRWHQEQQRWGYRWIVGERQRDVDTIYSTGDAERALGLIREYGVAYVYVGQLERLYYPESGLAKFDEALSGELEPVFRTADVTIYRLRPG